jgi:hypothetical protein
MPENPFRQMSIFRVEKHAPNRRFLAVEIKGGFLAKPDSIPKGLIYRASLSDLRDQIKRRKPDGMQARKSVETA